MQGSYWGYWLVVMGVAIVGLMVSVNGITATTTQDYYSLKEITEASMLESVDYAYYRDYNEVKMNKEKFMEVFVRMLAETMGATDTYEVNFYEMFEAPPKVSVEVKSNSGTNFITTGDYDVTTRIDAIIQIHAEQVGNNNGQTSNNSGSSSSTSGNGSNTNMGSNNSGSGSTSEDNSGNTTGNGSTTGTGSDTSSGSGNSGNTGSSSSSGSTVGGANAGAVAVCKDGITSQELTGMKGTAMVSKPLYENSKVNTTKSNVVPGVKFEILGEKGKYWAISYEGGCGWVDSTYMAINLKDYIPSITYSITNASSSLFKSYDGNREVNIDGLTGKQLYTSDFNSFVPATYSFAQKLKIAQANAQRNGDSLKIYEAYRPYSVTRYATTKLEALRETNSGVKYNTNYSIGANTGKEYYWASSWFLAKNISKHNTGCAVDITLVGKESQMPSAIHQLSTQAIKYYSPSVSHKASNYSGGMNKSQAAQNLSKYMMTGTGLTDLASEWWHYQDDSCHSTIGSAADFWSAI